MALPWTTLASAWFIVEAVFYMLFHGYLVKLANQRTVPRPYRAPYATDRKKLLVRLVNRILKDAGCDTFNVKARGVLKDFILAWFRVSDADRLVEASRKPKPLLFKTLSTISDTSSETDSGGEETLFAPPSSSTESTTWTIPGLSKSALTDFLGWALFGKNVDDFDQDENREMERCFDFIYSDLQLRFDTGPSLYEPHRMTLEDVHPWHRPLALYGVIWVLKTISRLFLRLIGFRYVRSSHGMSGWYRPGNGIPLVFFHGIAPAGLCFYLPMVLTIASDRALFLFDNPNIACSIQFDALSEEETVEGVRELVDLHCGKEQSVSVAGHSFGSCPVTWLLTSDFASRIEHAILLDPVTILLSGTCFAVHFHSQITEADVMINFLYSKEVSKVRMIAASELFTEYYLRRQFAWYNSELWLDETDAKILLALSGKDEIVPSSKVLHHAKSFDHLEVVYWDDAGHANCVTDPRKWYELRDAIANL